MVTSFLVIASKVINTQKVLKVTTSNGSLTMCYEMDFPLLAPTSRESVRVRQHHLMPHNLSEHLGLVELLHRVLLIKVLLPVYRSRELSSHLRVTESSSPPHLINTNKLLIKFTSPVVNARAGRRNCNKNIIVVLHILLKSIEKVVAKQITGVWAKSLVSMN